MIDSLCIAMCEDLLPILSMGDVDICKDPLCINSAFCAAICGGALCVEAMQDSLRSEICDDPHRIEETEVSDCIDICEVLLCIEPFRIVDW